MSVPVSGGDHHGPVRGDVLGVPSDPEAAPVRPPNGGGLMYQNDLGLVGVVVGVAVVLVVWLLLLVHPPS